MLINFFFSMHTVGTQRTVSADNTQKSTFCPPAARQKTAAFSRPNNGTTTVAIESNFDIYAFKNKEFKNVQLGST